MNQAYARRKYNEKYREIYRQIFDKKSRVAVGYSKRYPIHQSFYSLITGEEEYSLEIDYEYRPLVTKKEGAEKVTSIFAKDLLKGEMKELDEHSLLCVIRTLHKEGILVFHHQNNELMLSVVTMRYTSIIEDLIKLDKLQTMQQSLSYAIQEDDLELLQSIVEAMKRCAVPTCYYGLARYTVSNKNMSILEFLIENYMSHDRIDMKVAKERNNKEMLNTLIKKSPYLDESLQWSMKCNDVELAKNIIRANRVNIAENDIYIKLAVSYYCMYGDYDLELIQMLIDAGANVNAEYDAMDALNSRACIPLEEGRKYFGNILTKAKQMKKTEVVDLLTQAGAK